jgi:glycosyltransferase involved in cell wall biosynthesis
MNLSYIIITTARNEEKYIEKTIRSVISQTVLPKKWIIVSDGSTDNTDEIVKSYAKALVWIELIRLHEHVDRNFEAKVKAFKAGYERIKQFNYDILCNVDADVSFDNDYFEFLLRKFQQLPELGVAGTDYVEDGFHSFNNSYISPNHVNGQCQLFRRQCFEDIGGYVPIKEGGIDWVAVTSARMKGWETKSYSEKTFTHHHKMGRTYGNILASRFHYGKKDYFCGGHPVWELFRILFQMTNKPLFIGGFLLMCGYIYSWLSGEHIVVSKELMTFHRSEQMQRIKHIFLCKYKRER